MTVTISIGIILLIGLTYLAFKYHQKYLKEKEDSFVDETKAVKYSAKTLRENPKMIQREYREMISEINRKIENLNKEMGLDKYVYKNNGAIKFSGIHEKVLVDDKPVKVERGGTVHYNYVGITLGDLMEIMETKDNVIYQYKELKKQKDKLQKELNMVMGIKSPTWYDRNYNPHPLKY